MRLYRIDAAEVVLCQKNACAIRLFGEYQTASVVRQTRVSLYEFLFGNAKKIGNCRTLFRLVANHALPTAAASAAFAMEYFHL